MLFFEINKMINQVILCFLVYEFKYYVIISYTKLIYTPKTEHKLCKGRYDKVRKSTHYVNKGNKIY